MLKLDSSTFKVSFLTLVLLFNNLTVFGQKPPTSGPNIEDEENLTPIIIGGSALVVAAGSYFYLKSRGPKITVTENLQDFLWGQNIMPTPDAMHLMYELNPSLRGEEVMRLKKKLVSPEIPEIPEEIKLLTTSVSPTTFVMSDNLKGMVEAFKSSLNAFRDISVKITSSDSTPEAFNEILSKTEALLTAPDRYTEARSSIRDLLLMDLIIEINKIMDNALQTQELSEDTFILLHAIVLDLENLLLPKLTPPQMEVAENNNFNHLVDWNLLLAFDEKNPNGIVNWKINSDVQINTHKVVIYPDPPHYAPEVWFAFAVYKYDDEGNLITKGKEVEGKYQISYALPALKNIEARFHKVIGNATFGVSQLPLGKYYIKVVENDTQIRVQNPIIDFTEEYNNPIKELHKRNTKVVIYLLQ